MSCHTETSRLKIQVSAFQAHVAKQNKRIEQLEAELFELKNAPISFLLDQGKGE